MSMTRRCPTKQLQEALCQYTLPGVGDNPLCSRPCLLHSIVGRVLQSSPIPVTTSAAAATAAIAASTDTTGTFIEPKQRHLE